MLMVCHHLDPCRLRTRLRRKPHPERDDCGRRHPARPRRALSMMSSDSQAMGRLGEVIIRTWQTADKMKKQRGSCREDKGDNDNFARQTLHRQIHHQPGDRPRHVSYDRLGRESGSSRTSCCGSRLLRRQARDWSSRVAHRRGADGRSQRLDSDAAAGDYRPMFGGLRQVADGLFPWCLPRRRRSRAGSRKNSVSTRNSMRSRTPAAASPRRA